MLEDEYVVRIPYLRLLYMLNNLCKLYKQSENVVVSLKWGSVSSYTTSDAYFVVNGEEIEPTDALFT